MSRVTMSGLPLLSVCQYSGRDVKVAAGKRSTAEMALGTEVHKVIERELLGEGDILDVSDEAAPYVSAWLEWWESEGRDEFGGKDIRVEQAFAYDPFLDESRHLGRIEHRQYPPLHAGEIAGTADAIVVDEVGDSAVVIDWKTGEDFQRFTADAADNVQLRGYALAVARAFNVSQVRVAVVRITPAGVKVTSDTLDDFDLDAAAADLRRMVAAIPTAHPVPGTHCSRCRIVSACPATVAATAAIAPPEPTPLVVDESNAAALYERLKAVQAACDQVDAALRAYAEANGPVPLSNGKRWGKATQERSSIRLDGPEAATALQAMADMGVGDAVEKVCKTSQEAIKRVLAAQGAKGKELTSRTKAVMDELRAAGAVRTTTVEVFRESAAKGDV